MQVGGRLKICDFGLARDVNEPSSVTAMGEVFGTPAYMAPEQWIGAPPGASMDLYALGCVLYEMLTGKRPFRGPQPLMGDVPVPPCHWNFHISQALGDLTLSLLAKDPADRPPTARAVLETLTRVRAARQRPADGVIAARHAGTVACVSRMAGQLDIFLIDAAWRIRCRTYQDVSFGGESRDGTGQGWSEWRDVPAIDDGRVTAIATDLHGGRDRALSVVVDDCLYETWWGVDRTLMWVDVADLHATPVHLPVVDVAVWASGGYVEVFALDSAGSVWCREASRSPSWTWREVPVPAGEPVTAIGGCSDKQHQMIAAVAGRTVFLTSKGPVSQWSAVGRLDWDQADLGRPLADVACSAVPGSHHDVFVLDGVGSIRHCRYQLDSLAPSGQTALSGWAIVSSPPGHVTAIASGTYSGRQVMLVAVTADGEVHFAQYRPGADGVFGWSRWARMPLTDN